jgi:hypothetical protein
LDLEEYREDSRAKRHNLGIDSLGGSTLQLKATTIAMSFEKSTFSQCVKNSATKWISAVEKEMIRSVSQLDISEKTSNNPK